MRHTLRDSGKAIPVDGHREISISQYWISDTNHSTIRVAIIHRIEGLNLTQTIT
jgi:hypothetical protein